jgi:DNA primase
MTVTDSMVSYLKSCLDVEEVIRGFFPEYTHDGNVQCPFHEDTEASFHISDEGKAYCHGCGESAKDIIDLFSKLTASPYIKAREELYRMAVNAVPQEEVDACRRALQEQEGALEYLMCRGFAESTIKAFHLGYDHHTNRISIPVYDRFKVCVNMRLMDWRKDGSSDCDAINVKGHGQVRLYPEPLLVKEERVLLVEGEWDCLVARQYGLPAVTWTGGASSWDDRWSWMFAGKRVVVLYDNDVPGQRGAKQAVGKLNVLRQCGAVIHAPIGEEGEDLNDVYLRDPGALEVLSEALNDTKVRKTRKDVCPCCGQNLP